MNNSSFNKTARDLIYGDDSDAAISLMRDFDIGLEVCPDNKLYFYTPEGQISPLFESIAEAYFWLNKNVDSIRGRLSP